MGGMKHCRSKALGALGRELSKPGNQFKEEGRASVHRVQCASVQTSPKGLAVKLDCPEAKAQDSKLSEIFCAALWGIINWNVLHISNELRK